MQQHNEDNKQNIHFYSTLKEELYNDLIHYKMQLSNAQYYVRLENSHYDMYDMISNYDYRSKIISYKFQISENEKQINIINEILHTICKHEWETDYIEYGVDGPMKEIEFCKHCSINNKAAGNETYYSSHSFGRQIDQGVGY